MSRPWILITPSSRGIGFALTRHLLQRSTHPILATARNDPDNVKARLLENLPSPSPSARSPSFQERLTVVPLDVTSEATISAAAAQAAQLFPAGTHHLRLAFTMPGILRPEKALQQVDAEDALLTYQINTLGPLLLMKWFGGFLPTKRTRFLATTTTTTTTATQEQEDEEGEEKEQPSHAVWVAMSARVGSISDNRLGGWYSYRSSKAGVNSLVKSFDHHLVARSGDKAMALAYHPGTVKTDLSKEFWATQPQEKLFAPAFAVEKMVEVVTRKVGIQGRGRCWDWKGDEILP